MSSEKTCFKCAKSLPRECFYKHSQMLDGLLGKCKDCTKKDVRDHRAKNLEKILAYDAKRAKTEKRKAEARAYRATAAGKAVQAKGSKVSRKNYPERVTARRKLNRALKSGFLTRQPCFICGEVAEAHHPDYSAPLDVTWLCKEHHTATHLLGKELNTKKSLQPF
jgi:hypothetical protein